MLQITSVPDQENLIHLKNLVLAEYNVIYYANESFSVKSLDRFNSKYQLLFKKYESGVQNSNLTLVDTLFPIILADLVLDVFLNEVSTFVEYLDQKKSIIIIDYETDKYYFLHKIRTFIDFLLFTGVASKKLFAGDKRINKIYYCKEENTEMKFYGLFQQFELVEFLIHKVKLSIDFEKSNLVGRNVNLCLRIMVD